MEASALWAVGTRHQQDPPFRGTGRSGSRNSEEIQLGRVHRESEWLNQYMLDLRMAAASLRLFRIPDHRLHPE